MGGSAPSLPFGGGGGGIAPIVGGGIPGMFSAGMPGMSNPILQSMGGMSGGNWMDPAGFFKQKDRVNYGEMMETPKLSGYRDLKTLDGGGQINPAFIEKSPWATLAMEKQAAEQGQLFDNAVQNQASALAQGRNSLAMKGGLSSGASERMAMQGADDLAKNRQNILSQGVADRAGLGMQGAQMDTDINKFNATNKQNANQFNTTAAINDLNNLNEQNRFKYGEQMKMKGAAMSGQAMENSGKK